MEVSKIPPSLSYLDFSDIVPVIYINVSEYHWVVQASYGLIYKNVPPGMLNSYGLTYNQLDGIKITSYCNQSHR